MSSYGATEGVMGFSAHGDCHPPRAVSTESPPSRWMTTNGTPSLSPADSQAGTLSSPKYAVTRTGSMPGRGEAAERARRSGPGGEKKNTGREE